MIRVSHLTKSFNHRPVLRDLNFQAQAGEIIALLGPNGAGKTTFLRILATLMRPTAGEVAIAGFILPGQSVEARRRIGVVLHQPQVYGSLTAEENLRFYGRLYQIPKLEERIRELLAWTGLDRRSREPTAIFSRGMLQRLAIARASLHNPPIYLFDEPHTGLDPDASARLEKLIISLAGGGALVVFTSHELDRAANLATRFDVLHQGHIRASCSLLELPGGSLDVFYRGATSA